ncbi:BnaC07g50010D [Brassica napus]|uniref:(rape) hypothetical protein n=1 Tax=Brassica napus TaxID=3708 RepID=A0A078JBC4_BRANA|nr:unnamed protein product [Brassica napus]CDY63358.1 BnaC07g50010D [Brassica napus]
MRAACEEFSSFENKIPFLRLGSNHANKVLTYYSEWSEGTEGTWSSYKLHSVGNCHRAEVIKRLQRIRVLSHKLKLNAEEMNPPLPVNAVTSHRLITLTMVINIRQCMRHA